MELDKQNMIKVCIIGVYFGELPKHFSLWLKSAAYNNSVDFLIFTDQKKKNLPDNVRFVKMSLQTIKQLAENKLGFSVALKHPYKCCDFKPAYGMLFEEYISKYDYWGHCDFDLIWGDLRFFFNKYNLKNYDKFLSLGHLSLYRNTSENNRRFMCKGSNVGNYDKIFQDESNYAFDEISGVYQIYKKNEFAMFDQRIYADISIIYKRFRLAKKDKNYKKQAFCWEKGHIYRYYLNKNIQNRDEFMYIHFKKRKEMKIVENCETSSCFMISQEGFRPLTDKEKSIKYMVNFNTYNGFLYEMKELCIYKKRVLFRKIHNKILKKVRF